MPDEYQLERKLGTGAQGAVYGRHIPTCRIVVVKRSRAESLHGAKGTARAMACCIPGDAKRLQRADIAARAA